MEFEFEVGVEFEFEVAIVMSIGDRKATEWKNGGWNHTAYLPFSVVPPTYSGKISVFFKIHQTFIYS